MIWTGIRLNPNTDGSSVFGCLLYKEKIFIIYGLSSLLQVYYRAVYVNRLYNLYEHVITQQIEYQILVALADPKLYVAYLHEIAVLLVYPRST